MTTARFACAAALAAACLGAAAVAFAQPAIRYTVTKAVPLGAPDRWDYVVFDPASHRVYVAHGDRVAVVDGHDGKVLGEVDGMPGGTHGVAISTAAGKGYTDDGKAGMAVAFDLKTLKAAAKIPVKMDADAVAFDRVSGHIFVIEGDPHMIAVIDPKTDKVLASIDAGVGLEYAVADERGSLFVAGVEKRDVVKIDTGANTVVAHWPIPGCASPHGAAIDARSHRLFISCVNQILVVIDTDKGAVVASLPIGRGSDAAAFDARRRRVFSSNGADGTLSVIQQKDANTYLPAVTIPTAVSGRTMAVDPETGRVYIAAADTDPSPKPGGRARPRAGTLKLLFLDPVP